MEKLSLFICLLPVILSTSAIYKDRKAFHAKFCQVRPLIRSCVDPFDEKTFQQELERHSNAANKQQPHEIGKRSTYDDDDYEFYLWKKYRREKLRRKLGLSSSSNEIHYHYHQRPVYSSYGSGYGSSYYYPSYYRQQYYPTSYSYPSYGYGGYGYPSYGYGGGIGSLFNLGIGRQIGIMTPIGGFGYSSGFGIGIGK